MSSTRTFQDRIQTLEREEERRVQAIERRLSTADVEKRTAIGEVDRLQKFIIAKDVEVTQLQQELTETRQLYRQGINRIKDEERTHNMQRMMSLGRGRAITMEPSSARDPVRILAPKYTPAVPCFMPHGWDTSGHSIRECTAFLALSNKKRAEILFQERRCYGCFMPESVVGHTAAECPHPRYCSRCESDNHQQILCGPKEMYRALIPISVHRQ